MLRPILKTAIFFVIRIKQRAMYIGRSFVMLAVVLVFDSGRRQLGEALQKEDFVTWKETIDRRCDTFFHKRNVNGELVRPAGFVSIVSFM